MKYVFVDTYLISGLLAIGIVALAVVSYRYYKVRDAIFWDSSTYFILLVVLYVVLPSYVLVQTGITAVGASYATIEFSAQYALYFATILTIYYLVKTLRPNRSAINNGLGVKHEIKLVPIDNRIVFGLYAAITAYVVIAFLLNSPGVYQLWNDRALASTFTRDFNDAYKIQFLFAVSTSMIVYLACKSGRSRYIAMFLPFVCLNLMTTDRDLLYQSLVGAISILLITGSRIPVLKMTALAGLIVSMEVLRGSWTQGFVLADFLFVPGELLYSKEPEFLILESDMSTNLYELVTYSIGKVLSPQAMSTLFGGIPNFRFIIEAESQLTFGVGGSILSEVFSVKNNVLLAVYPFIAILYLEMINILRSRAGFFGILIFVFYLTSTHTIFRTGIIFASMEPVYYSIYAAAWYWAIRFMFVGRTRQYFPCWA